MANDLKSLPHWAQVAFAARCARRAQPAFNAIANRLGHDHIRFLDYAICVAERAAMAAYCPDVDLNLAAEHVKAAVEETGGEKIASGRFSPIDYARSAAMSAEMAINLIKEPNANYAAAASNIAIAACGFTKADSTAALPSVILLAVRRDFQCLQQHCEDKGWNDDTPVPSDVFGSIWPNGCPEGWPVDCKENPARTVQ